MERSEFDTELREALSALQEHEANIKKLTEDLQLILRPTGDVTFGAMERAKKSLESFKAAKDAVDKTKKLLKARATERMKDI